MNTQQEAAERAAAEKWLQSLPYSDPHPVEAFIAGMRQARATLSQQGGGVVAEPVAWLVDGGLTVREDWMGTFRNLGPKDGFVGTGRAIPDFWVPILFAAPPAPQEAREPLTDEQQTLLKFYSVSTLAELVAAQMHHIEKLQAKMPKICAGPVVQRVREG